jgi:hypothetical protein
MAFNYLSKLRHAFVSVKFFGAKGDGVTDDTAAFQAAIDSGTTIFVPDGNYNVSTGSLSGRAYWLGADYKAADGSSPLALPGSSVSYFNSPWVYEPSAQAGTYATFRVDRVASYTGGTPGFASSTLRVNSTAGAGVADYLWGITSVLTNNATAGENTAAYLKGIQSSTGPTWGLVIEATSSASAPAPLVGAEVAVSANNNTVSVWPLTQRVVVDVIAARPDGTGSDMNTDIGVRVTGNANAKHTRAFTVETPCLVGLDTTRADIDSGGDAIRLNESQTINFGGSSNAMTLRYVASGQVLQYRRNDGAVLFQVNDSGDTIATTSFKVGANKVVGARATGWSAPTGSASRSSFATSTVTTEQLAERLKALIDDLTTHGLIGS